MDRITTIKLTTTFRDRVLRNARKAETYEEYFERLMNELGENK